MVFRVEGGKALNKTEQKKQKTEEIQGYKIKNGDTIAKLVKAFNFKNEKEFREYFGLKDTAKLKAGQILKVPTTPLETTFTAISRKYNMSIADLKALNPQIENFDVLKKNTPINTPIRAFTKKTTPKDTTQAQASKTKPKKTAATAAAENSAPIKQKPVSAEDLARALKKSANKWGAVDTDAFKKPFSQINKNNVMDVIKSYDEISKGESLIEMICDEVTNSKEDRKNAVTKLFNTLCEKAGPSVATKELREEFMNELNDEFDSLFWISTGKMDKIINKIIKDYEEKPPSLISDPPGQISGYDEHGFPVSNNETTVRYRKGGGATVAEIRNQANEIAQRNGGTVSRPEPVLDENGYIVADVREFPPTGEGSLNGNTIIVNAGHGGYNPNSGDFDRGAHSVDANGKVIEEWYKNKNFIDELLPLLRNEGAHVIYMNGNAGAVAKAKRQNSDADLFISIHCDAVGNKDSNGQKIIYNAKSTSGKNLAEIVEKNLDSFDWINPEKCNTRPDDRGLAVLNAASDIPSVLIETGFLSNERDLANIDSRTYRMEVANRLTTAISQYLNNEQIDEIPQQGIDMPDIDYSNIESLDDVVNELGLSKEFIMKLKHIEDGEYMGDDEFHNQRYLDLAGNLTIGIGHLWHQGEPTELSDEEVCQLFAKDLTKAKKALHKLFGKDNFEKMPQSIKEALLDMTFNKGPEIIKKTEGLVWALKNERYEGAICKMTNNRSTTTGEEMSGLSKRRLFDMSIAAEMYAGNPPASVIRTAQQVYNNGIKLLRDECQEKELNFENQLVGYNRDVKAYWGDKIKLQ